MTPTKSKQLVLVSSLALIAIAVYRQNNDPGTLFRRVWGVGALAVMLSLLADFAPQIAGPFAVVTVLGSLTHGGDQALVNLTGGAQNAAAKVTGGGSNPQGKSATTGPRPDEGTRGPTAPKRP
jgi:hypothetical protein